MKTLITLLSCRSPIAMLFGALCLWSLTLSDAFADNLQWEGVWAEKRSWCADRIGLGNKSPVMITRKRVIYDPVDCIVTKVISATKTSFKLKLKCTMAEEKTETWEQTVSGQLGATLKVDKIANQLYKCK
jgi:hypothetical protein